MQYGGTKNIRTNNPGCSRQAQRNVRTFEKYRNFQHSLRVYQPARKQERGRKAAGIRRSAVTRVQIRRRKWRRRIAPYMSRYCGIYPANVLRAKSSAWVRLLTPSLRYMVVV